MDNRLQNWSHGLIEKEGLFEVRLKEVNYNEAPYITQYPYLADYIPNDGLPKRNHITQNYFAGVDALSDNPCLLIWTDNQILNDSIAGNVPDKNTILELAQRLRQAAVK